MGEPLDGGYGDHCATIFFGGEQVVFVVDAPLLPSIAVRDWRWSCMLAEMLFARGLMMGLACWCHDSDLRTQGQPANVERIQDGLVLYATCRDGAAVVKGRQACMRGRSSRRW